MRFLVASLCILALSCADASARTPRRGHQARSQSGQSADPTLCRRAPALAVLPPEQTRRRRAPTRAGAALESEADAGSITVTGTRIRSPNLSTPTPITVVGGDSPATPTSPDAAAPSRGVGRAAAGDPPAGLLTAGEHDDLLNPSLYSDYTVTYRDRHGRNGMPSLDTRRLLSVQVQDGRGRPVPFAQVVVTCANHRSLTLATFADGRAVFFPELDRLGRQVQVSVRVNGRPVSSMRGIRLTGGGADQLQTFTVRSAPTAVRRFDLALVVDTTGSMGDEIAYLRSELRSIVGALRRSHPHLDIRVALVFYRDIGDVYVTRTFSFRADMPTVQARLSQQEAGGGGDYPEAVDQALNRAVALNWRPDAVRSIVLVGDAPPHEDRIAATWNIAQAARARRIHITPVAASGVADEAEYIMRAMAATTQSRYLFLTDDSGIGNAHAEPTIDCYLVTGLNALLRRVLDSQISGRRIEPRPSEVVRQVGDYDAGRCRVPRADRR